jgi:hypothetical protein
VQLTGDDLKKLLRYVGQLLDTENSKGLQSISTDLDALIRNIRLKIFSE